jgi:tetratricopeptide (TPR) repeat protein
MLESFPSGTQSLYITLGEHERDFTEKISSLIRLLKDNPSERLDWNYEILKNENHSSTPHKTIYTGLELVFRQFWQFSNDIDKSKLTEQFLKLSNKLGYNVKIPSSSLINLGSNALGNEKLDQAQSIFELLVELYPESEWGYVNLGSVFYRKKSYTKAEKYFRKALEFNPNNPYTQDMLREIKK